LGNDRFMTYFSFSQQVTGSDLNTLQRDFDTEVRQLKADANAAILLPQQDLNPQDLALMIQNFNRTDLKEIALRAHALAKPHATQRVAEVCADCAGVGV